MILTDFTPYPGYTGNLNVMGMANLTFFTKSVKLSFNISGIDLLCTNPLEGKTKKFIIILIFEFSLQINNFSLNIF
jgi:hypothetical protein